MVDTNDHDETARRIIREWLAMLDVFSPGARCAALLTIARVAEELAAEEEAKIRDLHGC